MNKETFINYKNWRYAKLSLLILSACLFYYFYDQPIAGKKGNTFAGIFFGIISTLGILYLTYFGVRKRSYRYGIGSLVATLSAHVWLGIILLVLVPLHSGFSFNFNVHTFTYLVMVVVVISGIFGAYFYRTMPQSLSSQRGQEKPAELLAQLIQIDEKINALVKNDIKLKNFIKKIDLVTHSYLNGLRFLRHIPEVNERRVSSMISSLPEIMHPQAISVLNLIAEKRIALKKLVDEVKVNTLLKVWLYIHVPFTILLLILLFAHIFSVLYYWT